MDILLARGEVVCQLSVAGRVALMIWVESEKAVRSTRSVLLYDQARLVILADRINDQVVSRVSGLGKKPTDNVLYGSPR